MFGYLTPDKDTLSQSEYDDYKAYYCGVCHAIKSRYGGVLCACLTYDAAFIALTNGVFSEDAKEQKRCVINPFKKVWIYTGNATQYGADVNIYLAYRKKRDDWQDEKRLLSGVAMELLRHASSKAKDRLGDAAKRADEYFKELASLEKANSDNIDATAMTFGYALRALFEGMPVHRREKVALPYIGFNLGRWVYLLDAWDDLEKDEKRNNYNVLLVKFGTAKAAQGHLERVEYNLLQSLSQAGKAADLLEDNKRKQLLLNIIDKGALRRTAALLHSTRSAQNARKSLTRQKR